jgi:hypothetical protein
MAATLPLDRAGQVVQRKVEMRGQMVVRGVLALQPWVMLTMVVQAMPVVQVMQGQLELLGLLAQGYVKHSQVELEVTEVQEVQEEVQQVMVEL